MGKIFIRTFKLHPTFFARFVKTLLTETVKQEQRQKRHRDTKIVIRTCQLHPTLGDLSKHSWQKIGNRQIHSSQILVIMCVILSSEFTSYTQFWVNYQNLLDRNSKTRTNTYITNIRLMCKFVIRIYKLHPTLGDLSKHSWQKQTGSKTRIETIHTSQILIIIMCIKVNKCV